MSNFAMSALCRILTRGVYCGPSSCLSVTGLRDFCSRVSRLDRASSDSPVNLTYDVFDGKGDSTPLVFLHGLFGSKSNFHSIAKSLVQRTGRKLGADSRRSQPWQKPTQSCLDLRSNDSRSDASAWTAAHWEVCPDWTQHGWQGCNDNSFVTA